ncbi:MAG: M81 family metallopeptidase [Gammaproteobacteria bacterium]|nr:M81 family metallopeptidase [Gammaproteobacteria bacterium]
MPRIALAGFLHETNTFAPQATEWRHFLEADAWPGLCVGEAVLTETAGMNLALSGFAEAARAAGAELLPLVWASANPSGRVSREAYETFWEMLREELSRAGAFDALYLDLHGAMVAEHLDDGEGELLARLRRLLGPELPIVASLDFHANVSAAMLAGADLLLSYRSYPHVDMAETGGLCALALGERLAGRRMHAAHCPLDFLIPLPWQCTSLSPLRELLAEAEALERRHGAILRFLGGFPLADVADAGPSVLAYAEVPGLARMLAESLASQARALAPRLAGTLWEPAAAIAEARRLLAQPGHGPVILADTQDNPGGGAESDAMDLAHALLDAGVARACVALICDPELAAAAHAAGPGGLLEGELGGKRFRRGRGPLPGPFRVEQLGDGQLTGTGPFYRGCRMDLGPMARVSRDGLQLLVSSRKQQAADQAMLHHLGLDPADQPLLVLKSSVHFRADFEPLARAVLLVEAPGSNTADPGRLPFRRLRPGVGLYRNGRRETLVKE